MVDEPLPHGRPERVEVHVAAILAGLLMAVLRALGSVTAEHCVRLVAQLLALRLDERVLAGHQLVHAGHDLTQPRVGRAQPPCLQFQRAGIGRRRLIGHEPP